ncbi:MAG: single-stranded DNA-binding protein [bacterium]
MLNRVVLIGRLTADPEIRYTGSGIPKLNFTLAVDRPFQSAKGDKQTDFIPIIAWRKLAEVCKEYLSKGKLVAVDGRLQIRSWENPQGERRRIAEVVAEDVRFLEKMTAQGHPTESPPPPGKKPAPGDEAVDDLDEELGFVDEDPLKEEI